LKQELLRNLKLEFAQNFGNSFVSSGLFLKARKDAINKYTFINDSGLYQTTPYNLGIIYDYGFQVSGSVKLFKQVVVNPFLMVFNIKTEVYSSAFQAGLTNRQEVAIESGLSAIATFKHKIALSFQFQYNNPELIFRTGSSAILFGLFQWKNDLAKI
jgi:hypothetical protein